MNLFGYIDIPGWILIILGLLVAAYVYGTWTFGAFDGYSLPGPKPYPFIGSIGKMFTMGFTDLDCLLMKKYGKTIRYFVGRKPGILTMDEDIIKAVCVKEFHHFTDRRDTGIKDGLSNLMLSNAKGDDWRRLRHLLSPTFSSGKLKKMSMQVNKCAKVLVDNMMEMAQKREMCEIKTSAQAYTMDIIAATAFGLELNTQKDPDNPFLKMGMKVFRFSLFSPLFVIFIFFPFLIPILGKLKWNLNFFPKDTVEFFSKLVEQAIEERKKGNTKHVDFLQLMMDAEQHNADENDVTDAAINSTANSNVQLKGLSHKELIAQAFLFFIAGFETTASAITYLCYNLAVNPDKQDKLYEEVQKYVGDKDEVDYHTLSQMKNLDQCVNESLRLNSPLFRTQRVANSDVTIKGILIKKGWHVSFPLHAMHLDPDLWEDPKEFKPERFEDASTIGYKFMPFGMGPRNCIGMRLALMEVKVAVAHILKSCRLVKTEETLFPLEFQKRKFNTPVKPIKLGIEVRD